MSIGQNSIGFEFTTTHTDKRVDLLTRAFGEDGKEYLYVQADGAITANDVVLVDEDGQADQLDTTNSAGALGDRVAVAPATFADNEYGWVQIYGACTANVGSSCAANTKLNSTGTAGRVDDDATTGAETMFGFYTTGTESSNAAAAILNYPFIDATL